MLKVKEIERNIIEPLIIFDTYLPLQIDFEGAGIIGENTIVKVMSDEGLFEIWINKTGKLFRISYVYDSIKNNKICNLTYDDFNKTEKKEFGAPIFFLPSDLGMYISITDIKITSILGNDYFQIFLGDEYYKSIDYGRDLVIFLSANDEISSFLIKNLKKEDIHNIKKSFL